MTARALFTVFALALVPAFASAQNPPDGPIGTSQQQLVGGLLVTPEQQRDFGLLTLNNPAGSCSASMLNDSWAITAAHCVYPSTTATSPVYAANQISLTANWPGNTTTAKAVRVIAYSAFPFTPNDVALLQTNRGVFDSPGRPDRVLRKDRPMANLTVLAFGRGINQLAYQAGPTPVPVVLDGLFRSAQFDIASINPNSSTPPQTFSFQGKNGATTAGGDSGGPSYYQDWDDPLSIRRTLQWQLMGVHSRCKTTCLAGQNCTPPANPWTWVTSVQTCSDATVFPIRDAILAAIQDPGPIPAAGGTFSTTVPDAVMRHKRALYAMNIDEPLLAPAGAATGVQLTFMSCHSGIRLGQGCPLDPSMQIWGYDAATHHLLHLPSGECLNLLIGIQIRGGRTYTGAPIVLSPCTAASSEKWTIANHPPGAVWTVKSELSSQCLNAVPGTMGTRGGSGLGMTLPTPGKLTEMPCDGTPAQNFDDADAGFAARTGPR